MAEELLQTEIEALFASMAVQEDTPAETSSAESRVFLPLHKRRRAAAGQALASGQFSPPPTAPAFERYDFRRPDKLSKDQMRSLQVLHENFAGNLLTSLTTYLRAHVDVSLVSVEQLSYDEYIKTVNNSVLNILDVDVLTGQAILQMDLTILFTMFDRLLGGKGASGKIVRDLTEIEKMLTSNIVGMALADLKLAWESVVDLDFRVASMEPSGQFVQIVPGNDTIILLMFEISIGNFQGDMCLCLPYLLVKPVLSRLSGQRWIGNDKKKTHVSHRQELAKRLNTTTVPCIARLGVSSMTVSDLAELEVGQVLPMQVCSTGEESSSKPKGRLGRVDLMVGDQIKFRGRTGLLGRNLAVQIEQVVAPISELIAHRDQSNLTIGEKK